MKLLLCGLRLYEKGFIYQEIWFDAVDDSEKGLKARLKEEGAVVYDVSIDEVYF